MTLILSLSSVLLSAFFISLHPSPSSSAPSSNISYAAHCNSIVPESNLTGFSINDASFPIIKGSFLGGSQLFPASSNYSAPSFFTFSLDSSSLKKTFTPDILNIDCKLVLDGEWSERRERTVLKLSGFWSASNGKLCLVGNGQKDGDLIHFPTVVKLDYPNVSDISTSLVRGSIESLDAAWSPNRFDSVSLFSYSQMQYRYSMISQAQESCSHLPKEEESLGFKANMTCSDLKSYLEGEIFRLDYNNNACKEWACRSMFSSLGFLPPYMAMDMIKCLDDGRFHFVIQFANDSILVYSRSFDPRSSLVAEGIWDHEKNRLCVLACPVFLEKSSKYSGDDCSTGFSLWIRRVFTLENSTAIIGNMWSKRSKDESGKSKMVSLKGIGVNMEMGNGLLKYRYSKMDAVRKNCWIGNETKPGKTDYPELLSHWNFQVSRNDSSHGRATLLSVGETYYGYDYDEFYGLKKRPSGTLGQVSASLWNVSYRFISYASTGTNFESNGLNEIAAEGIYNAATRDSCMVGCRSLTLKTNIEKGEAAYSDFMDCEILVKIKFKSTSQTNHDSAEGTIISMRNESDPYFFEPLNISSTMFSYEYSTELRKKTRIEVSLILVSLIFSCICIAMQLYQVKRQMKVVPLFSMIMLIILALGHIIPLLSLTDSSSMVLGGGWLGLNEIAVGFFLTITYLLQLWLLQAAWFARSTSQSNSFLLLMLWVHVLWLFMFASFFQLFTLPVRHRLRAVKLVSDS